ncbi:MAG: transposase, partial [Lachnospiraceae bacterium]
MSSDLKKEIAMRDELIAGQERELRLQSRLIEEQKEYGRKLEELQKANRELEKRALKAECQRDEALGK